jgi:hypothetical protein
MNKLNIPHNADISLPKLRWIAYRRIRRYDSTTKQK